MANRITTKQLFNVISNLRFGKIDKILFWLVKKKGGLQFEDVQDYLKDYSGYTKSQKEEFLNNLKEEQKNQIINGFFKVKRK